MAARVHESHVVDASERRPKPLRTQRQVDGATAFVVRSVMFQPVKVDMNRAFRTDLRFAALRNDEGTGRTRQRQSDAHVGTHVSVQQPFAIVEFNVNPTQRRSGTR